MSQISMTVIPPTLISTEHEDLLELAVHTPNGLLKRELNLMLTAAMANKQGPRDINKVLVITTCQESKVELLEWGAEPDREKDRLLNSFVNFSNQFREEMLRLGYWADYVDPASGLLTHSTGQIVWPEVQSLERLRGYRTSKAGPCHILIHPVWGSKMYPATLFTDAPLDEIKKALRLE